jgi:DMSO/TMAO reductase YedYZ molybdopterin-dependent catalytic subunit
VAAGMALAVGELISAFGSNGQSLVDSVGNEFIDRAGGALIRWAISTLGTKDKPTLITGIVIVSLVLGGLFGYLSIRRRWVGPVGFAGFGLVGMITGLRDPQASPGIVILASVMAVLAGIATLAILLRIAATGRLFAVAPSRAPTTSRSRPKDTPTTPYNTRREFFSWAGGVGAFAGVMAIGARSLAEHSEVEAARSKISLPPSAPETGTVVNPSDASSIAGLSTYVTPNDTFYKIDTTFVAPQIDPTTWTLKITGMVDHPFQLTYDELSKLPQIEEMVTLSCVSNDVGGDLVGNATWQGVHLTDLLNRAGVQPGATQIVGKSVDDFTAGFPTSIGTDGRVAMVAIGMNGEPLPINHGFPARLVIAGLYGYVSATKWLTEINLTTLDGFDGYWIDKGWSKDGPIKTQSRIDVPKDTGTVKAGQVPIAGVAWAPTKGITKVEVQVDGGTWTEAKLLDVTDDNTWRQWVLMWNATPGLHQVRCRATDGTGYTQTDQYAPPEPNGATGWDTRQIRVV